MRAGGTWPRRLGGSCLFLVDGTDVGVSTAPGERDENNKEGKSSNGNLIACSELCLLNHRHPH